MKLSLIMAAKLYKSLKVYKNKNEQRLYDMSDLRINHKKIRAISSVFRIFAVSFLGIAKQE